VKILLAREVFEARKTELLSLVPEAEWVLVETDGRVEGDPTGCEIVYWSMGILPGNPRLSTILHRWSDPALRWVQGPAAGVEHEIWRSLLVSGVRLTSAAGVHAEPIAQYVMAWILAWSQGLQGQITRSRHHEWSVVPSADLQAATVGIIGLGGIGSAVARIADAIGMKVVATRRTPGPADHVDELLTPDRLHDLLAVSDYVVVCVPGGHTTRGMIDTAAFNTMKNEAVVINVARGSIIDDDALTDALTGGRIRGATLDVVDEEPLPADSQLWELPRCVITPHQSSSSPLSADRLDALFIHNLRSYLDQQPMHNEVFAGDLDNPSLDNSSLDNSDEIGQ